MNTRYSPSTQLKPKSRFIDAQYLAERVPPGAYAYRKLFGHNKGEAYCLHQIIELKFVTWSMEILLGHH